MVEKETIVTQIQTIQNDVPIVKIETIVTEVPVYETKLVEVEKQVPVDKIIQVDKQIPVDRIVQVEKEVAVSKITEVIREIPVDKVQTVTKEVAVDKVHTVDREIPITKVEVHTTEVPINTIVQVEKQVPVDKLVEVVREVPVDKVTIVEVDKPVFNKQSVSKLNEIANQIENVMGLKDLFKSKSNDFVDKYEILSKSIVDLENSVQQLNSVDFNTKIETLYAKLDTVNNFLSQVKFRKNVETTNDLMVKEINELNAKVTVLEREIERQQGVINKTVQDKLELADKYKNVANAEDIEKLRFYYNELLTFAFKNMGPTPFDPQEARHHWENLIK